MPFENTSMAIVNYEEGGCVCHDSDPLGKVDLVKSNAPEYNSTIYIACIAI